ncbi:hypothetical protein [Amycolatopsis sp. NPDC021455]|uniref:hypothetical protein n=1 Tax=Amycolatopsis sp. NPDC021455 TaxID=3154901 RepID=UPI0033E78691
MGRLLRHHHLRADLRRRRQHRGDPLPRAGLPWRGDFYGDDTRDGKPIKAHFTWSHITATSARWEQEFSADGGRDLGTQLGYFRD